jgi:hypothetical protein
MGNLPTMTVPGTKKLAGLRTLLRPLARFCLRSSLKIQDIIDAFKEVLIQTASEELLKAGHEATTSRLSVMTGLQRKDINRLKESPESKESNANFLARVVGQWQYNADFAKPLGKPRALTFEGAESEFATLVKSVSTDLNPYTVLFELERTSQVVKDGKYLKLNARVFELQGEGKYSDTLDLVGKDWDDSLAAASQNILETPQVPNLHLRTEFNNICKEDLPKIREWLLDRGTTLHEEARSFLAQFDKDVNPRLYKKSGGVRVSLGSYSYAQDTKEEESNS